MKLEFVKTCAVLFVVVYMGACGRGTQHFVCARADRSVSAPSAYPFAVDNSRVGKYAPESKSGAGHVYDDVLEYRVWFHPERGADPLNGNDDYYVAFAQYEKAKHLSESSKFRGDVRMEHFLAHPLQDDFDTTRRRWRYIFCVQRVVGASANFAPTRPRLYALTAENPLVFQTLYAVFFGD